ncbi:TetR family transcriptional regulator [Chitinophaga skermanii]|uniref:TetR family transcriptional regulator n=1 Tax=Chitinophaga skermanii TaxID=331697 RepID=A0A327QY87_9BACT|nr:TetR/AcrR family transcriptional regulator [Chitinophaga skermanii]RAJ08718.1 TetR family transcriptional regulator [Chitinophaga skermanii]
MRPKNTQKEQAIKDIALKIIAEEGLENLSMQKLAKEANISPRTIYLKYTDKDDLLIKLYIEEVIGAYEHAILHGFKEDLDFERGIQLIWTNAFAFFKERREAFALMQYGKSSPLLNKSYQEHQIEEGMFFKPIHNFLQFHIKAKRIKPFPIGVYRALLFAPLMDLVNEYFEYMDRPKQLITSKILKECCQAVAQGALLTTIK